MDFTCKARWLKDVHRTPDSTTPRYTGVVSCESTLIAINYAAVMELDVMAADIRNAYFQSPTPEKHYFICGPEFGTENMGKVELITILPHGGKLSGRDFWNQLRTCMNFLGFTPSLENTGVWCRKATKSNVSNYYDYALLYMDNCLVVSENPVAILPEEIGKNFALKEYFI